MTIAGLSGGGKSTIVEQLKQDFLTLNPQDFVILSFEFEMLIEDQISRAVSAKTQIPLKDMYSAFSPLTDFEMGRVIDGMEALSKDNVFYVDNSGTVPQIRATILDFVVEHRLREKNKGIIVTIDHVLLTKGKLGEAEKMIVDELMVNLVDLKKYFASIGLRCLFVCLSQLNRSLEEIERVSTPALHYPNRNDIFASSAIYNCSDYVLITHRPSTLVGMGKFYGPPIEGFPKGLPVKNPDDPTKDMIYWHLIKERFGKQMLLSLTEDFEFAAVKEINLFK